MCRVGPAPPTQCRLGDSLAQAGQPPRTNLSSVDLHYEKLREEVGLLVGDDDNDEEWSELEPPPMRMVVAEAVENSKQLI